MNIAVIITKLGQIKKIDLDSIKVKSRGAGGIKGFKLEDGDEVKTMSVYEDKSAVVDDIEVVEEVQA